MSNPRRKREQPWIAPPATAPDTQVSEQLTAAPNVAGCYVFADKHGNTLYVGKAKNLKNRVRSYFTANARQDERLAEMVSRIASITYHHTESELDALLLEYKLIKHHKPWYNSQLKSDRTRPYLRISADAPYPTLTASAEPRDDGARYFDCFASTDDIKGSLSVICRFWGLPQCEQSSFAVAKSSCIYRLLDGCMAPCSGQADPAQYQAQVRQLIHFFESAIDPEALRDSPDAIPAGSLSDGEPPAGSLSPAALPAEKNSLLHTWLMGINPRFAKMQDDIALAAEALDFEKAAELKQKSDQLVWLSQKARRRYHFPEFGAFLVLVRPYRERSFSVFYVSNQIVRFRYDFFAISADYDADIENLVTLVSQYGDQGLAPELADETEWLSGALLEIAAQKQFVMLHHARDTRELIEQVILGFAENL
ncbi:MAG: GIY-YIG nuclease family protein [Coriobacteriia bacterium]|nr:GIY-YIG nuclease family protein [Coriobacteriia bacterium]